MTTVRTPKPAAKPASRFRLAFLRGRSWKFYAALGIGIPFALGCVIVGYFYVSFSRIIDARMHGEFLRTDPRIFARPLIIRRGQRVTLPQMVDRLNDLGYAQRSPVEQPGQFAIGRDALAVIPRAGDRAGQTIRFVFAPTTPKGGGGGLISIETLKKQRLDGIEMDAPLLTALIAEAREKRRDVPLSAIPARMIQAVLAIEDRRFYDHSGVDWIGTTRAVLTNIFGSKQYLSGGSTITQQLVRNTFLTSMWGLDKARERGGFAGLKRKVSEWFMSVALERRLSKDKLLELYLNDVDLGQRGSFAIRGVPEAARLFFGKDVSNLSLVEAATIAGIIQAPSRYAPFNYPDRAKERRNVVLRAMTDTGFISEEARERAAREPLQVVARALESEAPYFVDYLTQEIQERTKAAGAVDVYTTLDLHYQRIAQDAVRDGLIRVDGMLSKRRPRIPQAALIAVDPRTGEILAMVGGRSYNQSQYNRAVTSKRQPGSVFKPFVFLAAFERAQQEGRTDITPATIVVDEPTSFTFNEQVWTPGNYDNEYDGPITLRRALAHSRNIATVKVAESTGFDNVAAVWRRFGIGTPPKGYPSIALGVFEASPFEIATAYTVFPNLGTIRPLRGLRRIVSEGKELPISQTPPKAVTDKETTFLVLNMMRGVINEGTAAGVRGAGFQLDAAGKTGTTNDLRDAWFVGFTPELLTVVWVGLDDNQALGLSGAQAALPIWTQFMSRALAGHANQSFDAPPGIVWVDIDRETGKLASPGCPKVVREAFLPGTEPVEICHLHYF
ncbi:MAG TPA: PBP1A family penicillin-binding protein [Vicinamibacterales bacterium]|nr:PBP1A family penicillin-binding protein [Vicinamibacterales bacterium]